MEENDMRAGFIEFKPFERPFGKYAVFRDGKFYLNKEISELLHRKTELICSYSGADEQCNHMICELIDLYSGSSPFNYSLGTCNHENELSKYWSENANGVINWFEKISKHKWYQLVVSTFDNIIESIDNNVKIFSL